MTKVDHYNGRGRVLSSLTPSHEYSDSRTTKIVSRRLPRFLTTHSQRRVICSPKLFIPREIFTIFRKKSMRNYAASRKPRRRNFPSFSSLVALSPTHTLTRRLTSHVSDRLSHLLTAHGRWKKAGSAFCAALESPNRGPFPAPKRTVPLPA